MSPVFAQITSQSQPLSGQKNRSSDDFQFESLPSGNLTVTFTGNPHDDNILATLLRASELSPGWTAEDLRGEGDRSPSERSAAIPGREVETPGAMIGAT